MKVRQKALDLEKLGVIEIDYETGRFESTCKICRKVFTGSTNSNSVLSHFNGICKSCKTRKTNIEKYGYSNIFQVPKFKEKLKQTNIEKYGKPNPQQVESIREKTKQTNIEKYGHPYNMLRPDFQEMSKQTCLERYGEEYFTRTSEWLEKVKQTNLEKYGEEWGLRNLKIQEKQFNTNLERYGFKFSGQAPSVKQKSKDTWASKTKEERKSIALKTKQTCLEKYGSESYTQTKECREKSSRRWRLYFDGHLLEMRKKAARKYQYKEIYFDSSWELAYFIYLIDHGIDFEYQCDPIEYLDNKGNKHHYIPDFKIGDQLVEIKGDHFFDEKSGKLINPFDRNKDELYEAKYNCMIYNKVMILKNGDMTPILEYVNKSYGPNFIKGCRVEAEPSSAE